MATPIKIFISHSSEDNDFTFKLAAKLREASENAGHKFRIWCDITPLHSGDFWPQEMSSALEGCTVILLIISPDAMESEWTYREYALAQARKKLVIPIVWKRCVKWALLADTHDINFINVDGNHLEGTEAFAKLYETILNASMQESNSVADKIPSPEENVVQQLTAVIQQNFNQRAWSEVIWSTGPAKNSQGGIKRLHRFRHLFHFPRQGYLVLTGVPSRVIREPFATLSGRRIAGILLHPAQMETCIYGN